MKRYPALAVTGGLGCGKSEVGQILERLGAGVLDADSVVHALLDRDPEVRERVQRLCGADVIRPDGSVDRVAIARQVFADPGKRRALEAILHPRVWDQLKRWREMQQASSPSAALVPLLFEAGLTLGWSEIWCVAATDEVATQRLRARGWTSEEMELRRRAQWPLELKMQRADVVIPNDGTREALERIVRERWKDLLERSA